MSRETVEVKELSAGYGVEPVLENISFSLKEGDLLLVHGVSGSGKTTLLRVLAGVMGRYISGWYKGIVKVYGRSLYEFNPRVIIGLIAYIAQEPWYGILSPTVEGEVIVNQLLVGRYDRGKINGILKRFGLRGLEKRLTYTLSAGETQRLLLASNTIRNTKIYLFDEPSSYLDEEARRILVEEAVKLVENKATIIVVDHYVDLWWDYLSKILVLRKGRQVYFGDPDPSVIKRVVKTDLRKPRQPSRDVLVRLSNVYYKYPATRSYVIRNTSFSVRKSSVTWIKGPNGVGKTTLLKIIAGLLKPSKGIVERRGRAIYIPENPLLFFSEPTVREELYAGTINRGLVDELVDEFNLRPLLDRKLRYTSSGERRRVAIVSALTRGYDVICVDEPTAGLDLENRLKVLETLVRVAEEGYTVVVAGHDPLLDRIANYVIEMVG